MINFVRGVYLVQSQWGLFLLENTKQNISEYLDYDNFLKIIRQRFEDDKVQAIIHTLEDGEKLILDLDKNRVQKVIYKTKSFEMEALGKYFSPTGFASIYEDEMEENI
jgi:hypothetical protein